VKRTPEQIKADLTKFCCEEAKNASGWNDTHLAYVAALTSAAHLCDQIASESPRSCEREAAKKCGDFIWSIADAVKAEKVNQ